MTIAVIIEFLFKKFILRIDNWLVFYLLMLKNIQSSWACYYFTLL